MPSIAQIEPEVLPVSLLALAEAMQARIILAQSLSPGSESEAFARLEAQVNAQLEASAVALAATT